MSLNHNIEIGVRHVSAYIASTIRAWRTLGTSILAQDVDFYLARATPGILPLLQLIKLSCNVEIVKSESDPYPWTKYFISQRRV